MKTNFNVIVAGCLCLDIMPDLEKLPKESFNDLFKPGRVILADGAQFTTGGAVSNTGLALHLIGIPTKLVAKIGNDYIGQIISNYIKGFSKQLLEGISIDQDTPSSYTVVISPPDIDRIFIHCPGTNNSFSSKDIQFDLLKDAALFHFGYPTVMRQFYSDQGSDLVEMFRRAKTFDVTTSLDMAFTDPSSESGKKDWRNILAKTLPFVDIFMPSIEELLFYIRRDLFDKFNQEGSIIDKISPELLHDLTDDLFEMGAKMTLIKLGSNGLYLRSASEPILMKMGKAQPDSLNLWSDKELWTPCFKVNVAGATGAGDVTIAGFLSGLLRGLTPERVLESAVAIGACSVEAANALGGLRTWEDTQSRVQKGWDRLSSTFDLSGWSCENNNGVWHKTTKKQ